MRCCATPASSPIAVASSHGSSAGSRIGRGSGVCSPSHHTAVDRSRRRQLAAIARRVGKRPEDPHPVRRHARLVLERAVRDDLRMGGQHAHHGRRAGAAQRRQHERLQARLEGAAQRRARAPHQRQRQPGPVLEPHLQLQLEPRLEREGAERPEEPAPLRLREAPGGQRPRPGGRARPAAAGSGTPSRSTSTEATGDRAPTTQPRRSSAYVSAAGPGCGASSAKPASAPRGGVGSTSVICVSGSCAASVRIGRAVLELLDPVAPRARVQPGVVAVRRQRAGWTNTTAPRGGRARHPGSTSCAIRPPSSAGRCRRPRSRPGRSRRGGRPSTSYSSRAIIMQAPETTGTTRDTFASGKSRCSPLK